MQMGLKDSNYWGVNYLYNALLYLVVLTIVAVISVAFQLRFFTQTNALVLFLVFIGWGGAQIALAFILSTFFNSARGATSMCATATATATATTTTAGTATVRGNALMQ
jgi:hypothetical protein